MALNRVNTNYLLGSYLDDRNFLLKVAENYSLYASSVGLPNGSTSGLSAHKDSVGSVAIGYGYDLIQNRTNAVAEITSAGGTISNPGALQTLLNQLVVPVSASQLTQLQSLVSLPTEAVATSLLNSAANSRESGEFAKYLSDIGLVLPDSRERAVIVSMWYQTPAYLGTKSGGVWRPRLLGAALVNGDRAEAWYQIRYRSSANGSQGAGVVARRFAESQMFGLYDDAANVTSLEAEKIFRSIQAHRREIFDYEAKFGVRPDGQASTRNLIQEANTTYGFNAVDAVQSLDAALQTAETTLLTQLRSDYAPYATRLLDNGTFKGSNIYLAPASGAAVTIDSIAYQTGSFAANGAKDLLIGSQQGDTLRGNKGDDVLIGDLNPVSGGADDLSGGAGNDLIIGGNGDDVLQGGTGADVLDGGEDWDLYVVDAESLVKKVVDSDGRGAVSVRYPTGNGTNSLNLSGDYVLDAGSGTWKNQSGSVQISGSQGNYGVLVTTPDGTTTAIQLSGNFDLASEAGGLGIRLKGAPAYTVTKTGGAGIDIMVGSYRDGGPNDPPPAEPYPEAPYHFYPRTELIANDELIGGLGNDELYGYMGDDRLEGGEGNDWLEGGYGNDVLIGGAGNDVVLPDEILAVNPAYQWWDTTNPLPEPQPGWFYDGYSGSIWGAGNIWTVIATWDGPTAINLPHDPTDAEPGDDVIDTGAGADLAFGGVGRDTLWLGDGDDIAFGGSGEDVLHGEAGNDLLYGDGDLQKYVGNNYETSYAEASKHGRDVIDGGEGDDNIYAGGGSDVVFGGSGDDIISADGQQFLDDTLNIPIALQGDDFVDGGDGRDSIYGFAGADRLYGGAGDDYLIGDYASLALGAHGNDYLDGGDGDDFLFGQGGADVLVGGLGANVFAGDVGNDILVASGTGDQLDGGAGNDTLQVTEGADVTVSVTSTAAADMDLLELSGGLSSDRVSVALNTTYNATSQTATFTFTDSTSVVRLKSTAGDISLGSALTSLTFDDGTVWSASEVRDHLRGIATEGDDTLYALNGENDSLAGLGGNDRFYGANGSDTFFGGDGNDWMVGNDGADVLDGGAGDDEMQGSEGSDLFIGGAGNDGMRDSSTTSDDVYRYELGGGFDSIDDMGGNDRLELGQGIAQADVRIISEGGIVQVRLPDNTGVSLGTILPSGQLDTRFVETIRFADGTEWDAARIKTEMLRGTSNDDYINGLDTDDTIYAGDGNDIVYARAGDDVVYGEGGIDSLAGEAGNDTLYGGAGNDGLSGGDDNDVLVGGSGDDYLDGGAGDDVFRFASGDGADTMSAGTGGSNRIEFAAGVTAAATTLRQTAGALTITYGSGDSVTVDGLFDSITGQMNLTEFQSISFADGTSWSSPEIEAEVLRQAMIVTSGADVRYLSASGDTLDGGDGNDTLYGLGGNDTLLGGNGADKLYGGIENDSLQGGTGNDTLEGADGNDTLLGGDGADILRGGYDGVDSYDGGAGNDTLEDLQGADVVYFGRGDGQDVVATVTYSTFGITSTIEFKPGVVPADIVARRVSDGEYPGLAGLELSIAGTSDKIVAKSYFNSGTYSVVQQVRFADGTVWDATRIAEEVAYNEPKVLVGTAAADTLTGGGGNDTFYGMGGGDTLIGKTGNDTYVVYEDAYGGAGGSTTSSSDVIVENPGEGTDLVQSSVSWILGENVENLTLLGTAAINGTGNTQNNALVGNSADNRLDGGAGADTMSGGAGNDTYVVDAAGDVITELTNEGTDTVEAAISWTLGANLENLTLTGAAAINATGNTLANVLTGNGAANTLNGGAGADTMAGGSGDDTYVVDNAADLVNEASGAGIDTVQTSLAWTLAANIENLVLTGSSAVNGTGNALDNVLTGNSANNTLTGAAGNDTLDGGAGTDTMVGGAGNDTYVVERSADVVTELASEGTDTVLSSITYSVASLANVENITLTGTSAINATGNASNNVLVGNAAANTLTGGTGNDTMTGGAGNDIYVVDAAGDVVTELAGGGTDTVQSTVTWTLGAELENLTLTGSGTINGTGNGLDNVLTGNSANNTLTGGAGNDTLDGGTGNDTMVGGTGNDTYVVNVSTDVVTEAAGEGTDTVQSGVTLTLGNNVENLTLTGSSTINGTGNGLDNVLTGNSANNTLTGGAGNDTLDGGTGNDTMVGGTGNDTYVVNVSTDVVTEAASEGTDTVLSAVTLTLGNNVENLTLTGSSAINGTGNSLNNVLTGNTGVNVLTGAAGDDTYDGGAGNDTFTDTATTTNEAYRWGIGSGLDNLTDSGGALDHVDLFAGVAKADLRFVQNGNNLELTISGQTDKLTINNWFASTANQIEEFRLSDGSKVLASEVPSLLGGGAFAASISTTQESATIGRKFALPVSRTMAALMESTNLRRQYLEEAGGWAAGGVSTDQRVHLLLSAMASFNAGAGAGERTAIMSRWESATQLATPM